MLRKRILYGIMTVLLLVMFIATNSRQVLFLLLCFPAAAVISFLLLLAERKNCSVDVDFPSSSNIKKVSPLTFMVKRHLQIPFGGIRVKVSYENYLFQEKEQFTIRLEPGIRKDPEFIVPMRDIDCGKYRIAFSDGRIEDRLGIWSLPIKLPGEKIYTVYPVIPEIDVAAGTKRFTKQEGEHFDPIHSGTDVTEVHDLRDYQERDPLNSIHWKLSGKLDKLIVREFSNPANNQVAILCDCAFAGYEEKHSLVNGVLGMTAAISQALVRMDKEHRICSVHEAEIQEKRILSMDGMLDSISELLEDHLVNMQISNLHEGWKGMSEQTILITGRMIEERCNEIGKNTDLTVIMLTEEDREYIEEHRDFKILVIPVSHMEKEVHMIEL